MQAMQVLSPTLGSSLVLSQVVNRDRMSCRQPSFTHRPDALTVCQLDSDKTSASSAESSRRNFMLASTTLLTAVTAAGFVTQPDSAQAAKRKPPPPEEKKPDEDEKYLSAYDAKVLATIRRKEALKALLDVQKTKAKTVRQPEQSLDIFGQASD